MSLNLRFLAVFSLLALSPTSFADTEDERDALRVEVEQLLQFGRLSIGDIDIASGELIAEFYERFHRLIPHDCIDAFKELRKY